MGKAASIKTVDNVSLKIPTTGYTLGLVGESGSGKTSLGMGIVNAIEPPGWITSGSIYYNGEDVLRLRPEQLRLYRWREVSMVYQSAMNSLSPVKTVSDHVVEVMRQHLSISKSEAKKKSLELLSQVGIRAERVNDYQHQLSGGMRQRVVIAMALALSPKMLIADEPTSALDVVVQRQILSLLKKNVMERNLSLIFITHEIAILHGLVENLAVMYKGEIVELGPLLDVMREPLHPYTEMLLDSLLTIDEAKTSPTSRKVVFDSVSENDSRDFCKYVNNCKYAFDRCRKERPVLIEVSSGRFVSCHKYS